MSLRKKSFLFWSLFTMFYFTGSVLGQTAKSKPDSTDVALVFDIEYKAFNLRDPFQTYIVPKTVEPTAPVEPVEPLPKEEELAKLRVQGIFWGGSFPQAIINDSVYKEQDKIEGFLIKKIDKEGIILSAGRKEFKLQPPALASPEKDKEKPRGGKR